MESSRNFFLKVHSYLNFKLCYDSLELQIKNNNKTLNFTEKSLPITNISYSIDTRVRLHQRNKSIRIKYL